MSYRHVAVALGASVILSAAADGQTSYRIRDLGIIGGNSPLLNLEAFRRSGQLPISRGQLSISRRSLTFQGVGNLMAKSHPQAHVSMT